MSASATASFEHENITIFSSYVSFDSEFSTAESKTPLQLEVDRCRAERQSKVASTKHFDNF